MWGRTFKLQSSLEKNLIASKKNIDKYIIPGFDLHWTKDKAFYSKNDVLIKWHLLPPIQFLL